MVNMINECLYFKWMSVCLVCHQASEDLLREHYWDLRSKPFFRGLMSYMSSGPIVVMVRFSHAPDTCPHDAEGFHKFRGRLILIITRSCC